MDGMDEQMHKVNQAQMNRGHLVDKWNSWTEGGIGWKLRSKQQMASGGKKLAYQFVCSASIILGGINI